MAAQGVVRLGALAHQHVAMFQDHGVRLLLSGFDRHAAHRGPRRRLADRLGIVAIILRAFDEGLDVLCRDQPHPMAQRTQHPRPMMRAATRLDLHLGWCHSGKKPHQLRPPHLTAQNHPLLDIDPMDRENMLGRINRYALIFLRTVLSLVGYTAPIMAHSMPESRPHQQKTLKTQERPGRRTHSNMVVHEPTKKANGTLRKKNITNIWKTGKMRPRENSE